MTKNVQDNLPFRYSRSFWSQLDASLPVFPHVSLADLLTSVIYSQTENFEADIFWKAVCGTTLYQYTARATVGEIEKENSSWELTQSDISDKKKGEMLRNGQNVDKVEGRGGW